MYFLPFVLRISELCATITQDTGLDFAENQWGWKQMSWEEYDHMLTSKEKHQHSGPWRDVEGDHSPSPMGVKLGWAVSETPDCPSSRAQGQGTRPAPSTGEHRWPEAKHAAVLAAGTKSRSQLRTVGKERDVWSKRSFTTSKAPSEITCFQGLRFWYFGLYSGKHCYKHKAATEGLTEPKIGNVFNTLSRTEMQQFSYHTTKILLI